MKRITLVAVLAMIAVMFGIAQPANAAESKSKEVHLSGAVSVHYDRVILKVVPDDDAQGEFTNTRHAVTYEAPDSAVGNYRAVVTLRNDNGSRTVTDLVMVVERNRQVSTPDQTETSDRALTNVDAKHPVRCDFNRSGEQVNGRFIAAGSTIDIYTTDDTLTYDCSYTDGAPAGSGTLDVTQLHTGAYLYDHPKLGDNGRVTLGCNGTRNNVAGECRVVGPEGFKTQFLTTPAGEFTREDYDYPNQNGGVYTASVRDFNGKWVPVDSITVPNRSSSRIKYGASR